MLYAGRVGKRVMDVLIISNVFWVFVGAIIVRYAYKGNVRFNSFWKIVTL